MLVWLELQLGSARSRLHLLRRLFIDGHATACEVIVAHQDCERLHKKIAQVRR